MREILFRGKKKESGMWVYGDLDQNDAHNGASIREHGCIVHAVEPSSIGQFTGLLDKEGNKIFEGDIIRTMSGIAVVVWLDAAFALESPGSEAVDWVYSSVFKQSEILGNIHETPELINQQQ